MSVALGTVTTLLQATANTSATVSGSYDATGLTGLILAVIYEDGGDAVSENRKRVSGVTYNGGALTRRAASFHAANNANPSNCELWEISGPASGSNTWEVSFDNATEDDTLHVVVVPITGAYAVGNTATDEGNNTAAETVNNTLTFSDSAGTAVIGIGLHTAGMSPVDSVSGWAVDHEDEQGAVDGGEAVAIGHYDTDAATAKTFSWSPGADTVSSRRWTFAALELVPAAAGPAIAADGDGELPVGEAQLPAPVSPGAESFTASPAFSSAISSAVLDPDGAAINITALLSGLTTGAATVTAPDIALLRSTWNAIRLGVAYDIEFSDGTDTARGQITFQPGVASRFATVGGSPGGLAHPAALTTGDECLGYWLTGAGPVIPETGAAAANQYVAGQATLLPFGYDVSAGQWIEGSEVTFTEPSTSTGVAVVNSTIDDPVQDIINPLVRPIICKE